MTNVPRARISTDAVAVPAAPSTARIAEAIKCLHNSIKNISVTDCPRPEHYSRSACSCPAAMASLKPKDINHSKFTMFQRVLDTQLLANKYAFDFVGEWDQASQRMFTEKDGKSPKRFCKAFIDMKGIKEYFGLQTSLEDTI